MTQPGGGAPEGAPQTQTAERWSPQPWPPQQQAPPPWTAQPPSPPQWRAQPGDAQWQPPPPRDSTRTMAFIALVLSGLTMLGLALSAIVPLLAFGLFASVAGDSLEEGTFFPSVATSTGGQVTPAADGSVASTTLAAAVTELVQDDFGNDLAGRVGCDAAARVAADVSVLCRASDPTWFGIVRFTGTGGAFEVTSVNPEGESFL